MLEMLCFSLLEFFQAVLLANGCKVSSDLSVIVCEYYQLALLLLLSFQEGVAPNCGFDVHAVQL